MFAKMPFQVWLEVCGELAVLRCRAETPALADHRFHLAHTQRLLEDGHVSAARDRLILVADELAQHPQLGGFLIALIEVLRLYDGVEQDPLNARKPEETTVLPRHQNLKNLQTDPA